MTRAIRATLAHRVPKVTRAIKVILEPKAIKATLDRKEYRANRANVD